MMRPVALIILDGWGYREETESNAIAQARTPNFDKLWSTYPHALLQASEENVGLPEGQIGNSEVGHMTIGAGTIIPTSLVRINKAARAGEFSRNAAFQKLFAQVRESGTTLHVMGLVSPGGIHSHTEHLYAFLEAAKAAGITDIAVHAFTDGRDVPPRSASEYLHELEDKLKELEVGHIASVTGRLYAMDRDKNWDRLKKFEDAAFSGKADMETDVTPSEMVKELYAKGESDEYFKPIIFLRDGAKQLVEKNDAVFIFNFRTDRVRMLTKKLLERAGDMHLCLATMTEYDPEFKVGVAFPPLSIDTTLGSEISKASLKQAHIAETEKFPHATYFFNGGRQEPYEGEEDILLDSRKDVLTHDLAPKMRAEGIADAALKSVEQKKDFIFINFANADMVGHTGNVPAIIEAVEEVDMQLQRVVTAVTDAGGVCIVSADHGNVEMNIDPETGEKHTAHTLNPVPCIITKKDIQVRSGGSLADLAPTILQLLGLSKPVAMTGHTLLVA